MTERTYHLGWLAAALSAVTALSVVPRAAAQQCDFHCGTERWAVKTLSDTAAVQIDTVPQPATVAELRRLEVPPSIPRRRGRPRLPQDFRILPVEVTTYRVEALLIGWKLETDEDFHLVIADTSDRTETMIAEVPSPTCLKLCQRETAKRYAA